jgi:hypothetical protein
LRPFWAAEYKKNSEIVYRHPPELDPLCTIDAHRTHGNNGMCTSSIGQMNLMQFHISYIEGQQSEMLMRDKIFAIRFDDIQKLPKFTSKERSKNTQVKWIHALAVVLHTIVEQEDWIENKVYSFEDFERVFEATARVQNVMSMLMKDEIFDDRQMYKVFICYYKYIKEMDEMNDRWMNMFEREEIKKKRFFLHRCF